MSLCPLFFFLFVVVVVVVNTHEHASDKIHIPANGFRLFQRSTGCGNMPRNVEMQLQKAVKKTAGKLTVMLGLKYLKISFTHVLGGRKCIRHNCKTSRIHTLHSGEKH